MDNNLDKIALDLYGKIQTRFPNIQMGDENAEVLSKKVDIPRARFFEFEYEEDGEPLGTITITLDQDDGIVVQVSGDLVDDDSGTTHHNAFKFIRSFRKFAKNRLLNFDVQNIGKSNLDKRDYHFQAKRKELPMMESKMFGTSKISYQNLGEARLIVKHNQPINPELAAGRTMHIASIYIENADGERFKYPYKHLSGARALAEHVRNGGNPYDSIGKHITKLSEELASLRKFKGYVGRQSQLSEAMGEVTNRVIDRIEEVKKEINSLQRPTYYQQFAESFVERIEKQIPETIMNDWIDRLTVRTFNEDMKSVFPFLYNIVDESELPVRELSVKDLLSTPKKTKSVESKSFVNDPEIAFESFINQIMLEDKDELFSSNKSAQKAAIEKLNDILKKELRGGPDGVNAIQSLAGLIDDPDFLDALKEIDPDLDTRPLIQQYVTHRDPGVAIQLKYGEGDIGGSDLPPSDNSLPPPGGDVPPSEPPPGDAGLGGLGGGGMPPDLGGMPPEGPPEGEGEPGATPPAPGEAPPPAPGATPPAPGEAPPPAPPVQEGMNHKKAKIKARFIKAKAAGATLETQFAEGMTILDAIIESGLTPSEIGFYEGDDEGGEPEDEHMSGVEQILKSIAGFWNAEEKNFTIGGTRVKTKVIKGFKDGDYSNASEDDVRHVLQKIDQLDPSEDSREQHDVLRLAGVDHHEPEHDHSELDIMMKEFQRYAKFKPDTIDKQKRRKTIRNNYEKNHRNYASKFR